VARPDSGGIDRAVIGLLQNDAQLAALLPEGVWFNRAAPGLTRFVLVGFQSGEDEAVYGQLRASESRLYSVQGIGLSTAVDVATMKAAAYRIDVLLASDAPLTPPDDYDAIDAVREEPIAETPEDELDKTLAWHHYGGFYRVTAYWPDLVTLEE
jgi:hypothetical protein